MAKVLIIAKVDLVRCSDQCDQIFNSKVAQFPRVLPKVAKSSVHVKSEVFQTGQKVTHLRPIWAIFVRQLVARQS